MYQILNNAEFLSSRDDVDGNFYQQVANKTKINIQAGTRTKDKMVEYLKFL